MSGAAASQLVDASSGDADVADKLSVSLCRLECRSLQSTSLRSVLDCCTLFSLMLFCFLRDTWSRFFVNSKTYLNCFQLILLIDLWTQQKQWKDSKYLDVFCIRGYGRNTTVFRNSNNYDLFMIIVKVSNHHLSRGHGPVNCWLLSNFFVRKMHLY